ncbi:hypothetical protein [uncultured Thalassolituus sp.]|uniref:hypothetical protein n=1 Tax=uncultured Thalassolituus sp. TaxID=285273 RepID=UPI00262D5027|nr:hypothetical protein [uncultured Thalassolituus sp.]
MFFSFRFLACIAVSLICGCMGEDADNGTDHRAGQDPESVTATAVDVSGDAAFAFIDVELVSVTFSDTHIEVSIQLLNIPEEFVYDASNLSANSLEYDWAVSFDVDFDGSLANDLVLSVSNFKFEEEQQKRAEMLAFTQNNIWRMNEMGSGASMIGNLSAEVNGNSLTITVAKDDYEELSAISNTVPFLYEGYYATSGSVYRDLLPDDGGYFVPVDE